MHMNKTAAENKKRKSFKYADQHVRGVRGKLLLKASAAHRERTFTEHIFEDKLFN